MFSALKLKLRESFSSVIPIVIIVIAIYFTPFVSLTLPELTVFLICSVFVIAGIALFNLGADIAMTPMGQYVGSGLTRTKKIGVLASVAFLMGVLITVAEPDLTVLAKQVSAVMNETVLQVTVGVGVGLFLVIAVLKIIFKRKLAALLMYFYMILFALTALLLTSGKADFVPMCFDSGGVTTGPITVPFIMALGFGISETIGGKNSNENSFGLVAMCSVGPMLAVLILSLTADGSLTYEMADYSMETYFGDHVVMAFLSTCNEVLRALLLIIAFFIVLQIFILKLPKERLIQIGIGILLTFFGLVIFLTAVNIGFMPVGFKLGTEMADNNPALLISFGFIVGMLVVVAEPAVHVLNKQVEEITGGTVTKKSMMIALAIGVGSSIALSLVRMVFNFSILYYLIPGYLLSLGLSFFVPQIYTAIAFDSGGVASGPLTSSFILPMIIGACSEFAGEDSILGLAFGVVAMVAMAPLISIQALGFKSVVSERVREKIILKRIISADDEQIIYFE